MKRWLFVSGLFVWLFGFAVNAEPNLNVSGYALLNFQEFLNDEGKYSVVLDGDDWVSQGPDEFNQFDITRVYLTFSADLNEKIGVNATTDLRTDTDGYRRLYLKYGYVEIKDLLPNTKIRFGLQDPPWGAYVDNVLWRYRIIDPAYYNYWGLFSTADFGLSILGDLFDNHLQYHLAVLNGEGYAGIESDRHKEYVGRLTLDIGTPDKFRIYPSIGYSSHRYNDDENFKDDVFMTGLGMDFWRIHLAGEYHQGLMTLPQGSYPLVRGVWPTGAVDMLKATAESDEFLSEDDDVNYGGYAIYTDIKLADRLNLFGRYDYYDPNTDADYDRDGEVMWTAGICYHPWDNLWISLDYRESLFQEADPDDDGKDELKPTQIIYTHWKIAY